MSQGLKGGRKLARTAKHAAKYKAQFERTRANKARRAARIKRRKVEIRQEVTCLV